MQKVWPSASNPHPSPRRTPNGDHVIRSRKSKDIQNHQAVTIPSKCSPDRQGASITRSRISRSSHPLRHTRQKGLPRSTSRTKTNMKETHSWRSTRTEANAACSFRLSPTHEGNCNKKPPWRSTRTEASVCIAALSGFPQLIKGQVMKPYSMKVDSYLSNRDINNKCCLESLFPAFPSSRSKRPSKLYIITGG